MAQSLAQVWLHIVFSTKGRRPFLKDGTFRTEMFRMLVHQVNELGAVSASVGGHIDNVHLLVGMPRTKTIAKLVEFVRTGTSKWASSHSRSSFLFGWQAGYGAFSVSHSMKDSVEQYIRNQDEHHATRTFQDEIRLLVARHGIEIDERYVWD